MPDQTPSPEQTKEKTPAQEVPADASVPASAETSPSPQGPVEQDEKLFAAIGYIFFLFVVPLIIKPKSKFCKFHAKQSMVLFLTWIVVLVVLAAIPWFGSIFTIALFALNVLAFYRAFIGDWWSVPVLSKFAGKMDVESLYGKAGLAVGTVSGLKEKVGGVVAKAGETVKTLGKQEEEKPAEKQEEKPVIKEGK